MLTKSSAARSAWCAMAVVATDGSELAFRVDTICVARRHARRGELTRLLREGLERNGSLSAASPSRPSA